MKLKTGMKLIPALVLGLCSGYVSAAGFQLTEQNASGIGNAYAGSAAVAENASTIFFNPAGMTQLKSREVSAGLTVVQTSFKFSNNGSTGVAGAGNGGDGGTQGLIPNGYLSWALNKDLYVGVGVGAPFGLKTEYDKPWVGSAQSNSFDIKTYNINPSIAYRVSDQVSLGAGVSWQRMTAEYKRAAATFLPNTGVTLDADSDEWGWNVGALFTISPGTKIGVSYRSAIKHTLTGTLTAEAPVAVNSGAAKADIELPETFIFSATHVLNDRVEMLGDISWTGWSSVPYVEVIYSDGRATALGRSRAQVLDTDFRDTWRVALGANYKLSDSLKLKFGVAYDQTPVKAETTRLTSLPDNDRTWLSFGAQWKLSKDSTVDVGAAYLFVKDASINNNQTLVGRGRVIGNYEDSAWILGAQYSTAF